MTNILTNPKGRITLVEKIYQPGTILNSSGIPTKPDDLNRIVDSQGYTLQSWSNGPKLEDKVQEVSTPKKPGWLKRTAMAMGLTAAMFLAGSLTGCKSVSSPNPGPDPNVYYNLVTRIRNIFTGAELTNGNVILNGESKPNASTYSVKNGVVSTLDVDNVAGFIQGYIAGRNLSSGAKYNFRDKNGHHSVTIAQNANIDLWLIPNDFDTELLAKCVGESQPTANGEELGNGIIQNYNKQNIPFGVRNAGAAPTAKSYEIIKEVRKRLNQGANNPDLGRIIYLEDYTDVTSDVPNGFTAEVDVMGGGHSETMNGNIIVKSDALLYFDVVNIGLFFREAYQAVSGIRFDAGRPAMPYINPLQPFNYHNDGERAMQLANLLPPGFHLDPDSTPTNVYARIYPTSNRDPNYIYITEEPGLMNFANPAGRSYGEQPRVRKIPRKQYEQGRGRIKK